MLRAVEHHRLLHHLTFELYGGDTVALLYTTGASRWLLSARLVGAVSARAHLRRCAFSARCERKRAATLAESEMETFVRVLADSQVPPGRVHGERSTPLAEAK